LKKGRQGPCKEIVFTSGTPKQPFVIKEWPIKHILTCANRKYLMGKKEIKKIVK